MPALAERLTVVVATRDRAAQLLTSLERLTRLGVGVIVVDNGSGDGTPRRVRESYPGVRVVEVEANLGGAGRTVGVALASTPYVAFADDDSWWAPASLGRAADLLDAHPRVAVVAGRVLVEPGGREDPVVAAMRDSPLGNGNGLPGPSVLGFVACGAVLRRRAYLRVGGFAPHLVVGGEEALLALDLAAEGWALVYRDDVVAHHAPAGNGARPGRRSRDVRNRLLVAWTRRSSAAAARLTLQALARAHRDPAARQGVAAALRDVGWILRHRHPVPAGVERAAALLDRVARDRRPDARC